MADEDRHSKTEQPTSKRLEEARKKSGPPQSRDLSSVVSLFVGMIFLYSSGAFMLSRLQANTRDIFSNMSPSEVTEAGIYSLMLSNIAVMAEVLLPFMLAIVAASIVVTLSQSGGFTLSSERISFNLDKLNPMNGFSRLFNKSQLVEMVKAFLKIIIVGYVSYKILRDELGTIMYLTEQDIPSIFSFVSHLSFKLVLHTCGIMLVLGILDLIYQKWKFVEDLKMTKDEVKRESKDSDGNPEIKGKMRAIRMERAAKRLRQVIPKADVVITNPTHFAVALKYDRDRMAAPMVIAKGADHIAQVIKEIAREHKVVIVENKPLARKLFSEVKEDQEVPEGLYAAVAEVLAYVYSLRTRT